MDFYEILLRMKLKCLNGNLCWYENLFAKAIGGASRLIAKILKIKGKTIVWNQLVKPNASSSGTSAGVDYSYDGNGSITLSGTATGTATIYASSPYPTYIVGHKYFLRGCPSGGSTSTYALRYNGNGFAETGNGIIITATASSQASGEIKVGTNFPVVAVSNGYAISGTIVFKPQMFDLTLMGLDSLTLAEVKQWFADYFPLPIYAYDSGSLLSFNGTGIKTTGFNQWDEEWEVGMLDVSTGQNSPNIARIRSKNYIPVFPQVDYYWYKPSTSSNFVVCYYDKDKNYLSYTNAIPKATAKTPVGTYYARFYLQTDYGTTYNHDICINISSDRNGEYEPYTTSTLDIPTSTYFPTGMKSAGSVYDELTPSKAIQRVGYVDLGSLTWQYNTSYSGWFESKSLASLIADNNVNLLCPIYDVKTVNASNLGNSDMFIGNNANGSGGGTSGAAGIKSICVRNSSYTDKDTFKTAMNGVYLYYELATPTETDVSLSLKYDIEWGGTEEVLPTNTGTPTTTPILADIQYPDGERDDQYFSYREITQTNVLLGKALNTIMGRDVPLNREALDILMKGE